MSQFVKIGLTRNIRYPNEYVKALSGAYKNWILDEETAPFYKGKWLSLFSKDLFLKKKASSVIDLEIGTGTGTHFTNLCLQKPHNYFLALEIKYKALIQTIRRARKNHLENMRGIRYNAKGIADLFKKNEINNVYLHFPDPWLKKRSQKKHQLIQLDFCNQLYDIQKASSFLDFKTDSLEYFENSLAHFKKAGYKIEKINRDLYSKEQARPLDKLSQFEGIFVKKQQAVKYARLLKE